MPTAVDSSVLLDVLLADPQHAKSSEAALREAMAQDGLVAGEVVIAHGRSDAEAIGNAVRVAALAARQRVSSRIAAAMASADRGATVASVEPPDEDWS